jgi:hypothetical protein
MIDPIAYTYSTSTNTGSGDGSLKYRGGTLLPDGRVIFMPISAANVGVLSTMVPVDPAFCLSPYFNKF